MKRQAPYDLEGRGKWPSPDNIPTMNASLWNCEFDVATSIGSVDLNGVGEIRIPQIVKIYQNLWKIQKHK